MYPDLNPHYKVNEVLNYELFIDPEGNYYKVKTKKESDENMTHYEWAKRYLEKNNILDSMMEKAKKLNITQNPNEIMIEILGFIRYTHLCDKPLYDAPTNLFRVTEKQLNALYELAKVYHEIRFYEEFLEETNKSAYKQNCDRLFEKYRSR